MGTDGVAWEMRRTRRGWGEVGFGEKGRRKRGNECGEGWNSFGVLCGLGVLWVWVLGRSGTLGFVFGDLMAS